MFFEESVEDDCYYSVIFFNVMGMFNNCCFKGVEMWGVKIFNFVLFILCD